MCEIVPNDGQRCACERRAWNGGRCGEITHLGGGDHRAGELLARRTLQLRVLRVICNRWAHVSDGLRRASKDGRRGEITGDMGRSREIRGDRAPAGRGACNWPLAWGRSGASSVSRGCAWHRPCVASPAGRSLAPATCHQGKWSEDGMPRVTKRACHVSPREVERGGHATWPREVTRTGVCTSSRTLATSRAVRPWAPLTAMMMSPAHNISSALLPRREAAPSKPASSLPLPPDGACDVRMIGTISSGGSCHVPPRAVG